MHSPSWQALSVLPQKMVENYLKEALRFMENNLLDFSNGKHYGFSKEEIYELEALIVDQDFVDRDDCYNVALGGFRGPGIPKGYKKTRKRSYQLL